MSVARSVPSERGREDRDLDRDNSRAGERNADENSVRPFEATRSRYPSANLTA
jgi:hypothetical protein